MGLIGCLYRRPLVLLLLLGLGWCPIAHYGVGWKGLMVSCGVGRMGARNVVVVGVLSGLRLRLIRPPTRQWTRNPQARPLGLPLQTRRTLTLPSTPNPDSRGTPRELPRARGARPDIRATLPTTNCPHGRTPRPTMCAQ